MTLHSRDVMGFATKALLGYPVRTGLMLVAMAIGVGSVLVLTALGEGARGYVTGEFASLGTNMVIVLPGRSETGGMNPGAMFGDTPRDLTLGDASALERSPRVQRVAPLNVGSVSVSYGARSRDVVMLGSTHALLPIRHWRMAQGRFLPLSDIDRALPVAVLGENLRDELFAAEPALGQWIRIADRRFRVIGILASSGQSIGVDTAETIIVPVAAAQQLLNTQSLFRILVEARSREGIEPVKGFVENTIAARHQGERDVTVTTQDAVLSTFDEILSALTIAVGGIAGISLAVAGILIMNVMLVAISERTAEIGLLKAIGATSRQIILFILVEASLLALFGALIGLALGHAGAWAIRLGFPTLPAYPPWWVVFTVVLVAVLTAVIFSLFPARSAAKLNPVLALSRR
ncbi:macrolide export ATP-binding/permease protein MacB [Luminiphilus syltensis NOR5-1B]|uniref:Macrolide export ATP-binding/permease protein MacB n=1 Tax=Luminiphilus syltensis NOR5-1B TaxID=565045 RepID=B8KV99_9GAMM|nr:ABC transporter permease [Luminiphilus syltensis]EED34124.1 macrolide export ATP-binding/permease protein MacB [Luminiphilus syltensis NOR5-1B]